MLDTQLSWSILLSARVLAFFYRRWMGGGEGKGRSRGEKRETRVGTRRDANRRQYWRSCENVRCKTSADSLSPDQGLGQS